MQSRKSDRTRQAILAGALEFLWSRPFREMTVAELMSISGASRPAFYQYFNDLHDLMETLLQGIESDILGVAAPWLGGEGDSTAMLDQSLNGLVKVCYQRGPILRAVADASASDERLEQAWAAFLTGFDDAVTTRIEQLQVDGVDCWPRRRADESVLSPARRWHERWLGRTRHFAQRL